MQFLSIDYDYIGRKEHYKTRIIAVSNLGHMLTLLILLILEYINDWNMQFLSMDYVSVANKEHYNAKILDVLKFR